MTKLRAWKYFSLVMTLMLVLGLCAVPGSLGCSWLNRDPVVTIPDAGLEAAIREAVNKPEGDLYLSLIHI